MNKISVEIVKDFDGSYYANVVKDDEYFNGLPEYVDYKTLKKAIKEHVDFKISSLKELNFERCGRKQYAQIRNH